eukprot:TRINITY_DN4288_c0_g1_i1.p1 TRINITY_DN4288_c0_g1~~TRINITY_DN4288_c0_g1_i1.p1  ORF type:complete len:514 (+),score=98.70 TRINITY_DN4288_c0_g1_i1:51-1592(+)
MVSDNSSFDENNDNEIENGNKLSLWGKLLYGSGNISRFIVIGIQAYYLNPFLLEVANIDPYFVGTILLLKQIYDGITDPIVGQLSDSFPTPWGRRKPWILVAIVPSGIIWFLTWWNPDFLDGEDKEEYRVVYYLIVILIFNTLNSCVSVPYYSLTPDLAREYNERTKIVFIQQVFGLVSSIIFTFLQSTMIEYFGTGTLKKAKTGYAVSAIISGPILIFTGFISVIFIKERKFTTQTASKQNLFKRIFRFIIKFLKTVFSALLFKEYVLVTSIFVLSFLSIYFTVNNLILFVKYVVKDEEYSSIVVLSVQIGVTVSFFFWAFITTKIGKKKAFYLGAVIWSVPLILLFFIQENMTILLIILCVIRGLGAGVGYLIPYSMLPDVIELDEKKNGLRREGLLYSVFILMQKLGLAVGLSGSSYILGLVGYKSPETGVEGESSPLDEEQPDSVILTLRILTCIMPVIFNVLACILVFIYKEPSSRSSIIKDSLIDTDDEEEIWIKNTNYNNDEEKHL